MNSRVNHEWRRIGHAIRSSINDLARMVDLNPIHALINEKAPSPKFTVKLVGLIKPQKMIWHAPPVAVNPKERCR
jgi:hypothetical protein